MIIRLIREPSGPDCTFGVMFIDGFYQCLTLENTHKIIPAGEYDITFYDSPHNKTLVPLLMNVPGRSEIEIHIANFFSELEGCIAVGTIKDLTMLMNSQAAFGTLMAKLDRTNVKIKIEEWAQ